MQAVNVPIDDTQARLTRTQAVDIPTGKIDVIRRRHLVVLIDAHFLNEARGADRRQVNKFRLRWSSRGRIGRRGHWRFAWLVGSVC